MNDWKLLLIPVIAMIVAVLASIFRGAEEMRRRNNQRPGSGSAPRREGPVGDSNGLDQFLEEIRRRQAARQESARSAQRETRRPREGPTPVLTPVDMPPPRRREVPVLEVALEVPPAAAAAVTEVAVVGPSPIAPPVLAPPAESAVAASAVREQTAALLKSKSGLRTAFVMREVLGMPMCRRRR